MMNGKEVDFVKSMENASLVLKALSAERVVVRAVTLVCAEPVIRISPCAFSDRLAHEGKASYLEFGCGAHGRYRQGQYHTGGCKVVWSEALH